MYYDTPRIFPARLHSVQHVLQQGNQVQLLCNNWDGEETGWAGQENIVRFAQENNLNMNQFIDCNNELKYQNLITNSNSDAQSLGLTGTPAFFVISTNSQQVQTISGAHPYEVFERIFNSMLDT